VKVIAVIRTATVVLEVLLGLLLLHLNVEAVNFIISYHVALKNVGITRIAAACNHSITLPSYICVWGMTWHIWFRYCAMSWQVVGLIPDGLIGIFH
jgi:hypothetical protein